MPTATHGELLIETVPQVIETEAQHYRIARPTPIVNSCAGQDTSSH